MRDEPIPPAVRAAQVLLFLPLGAFQLVAAIVFSATEPLNGVRDHAVATWVIAMSAASVFVSLQLTRRRTWVWSTALGLLVAQFLFNVVKLTVYQESGPWVFLLIVAATAMLLSVPAARRYLRTSPA